MPVNSSDFSIIDTVIQWLDETICDFINNLLDVLNPGLGDCDE